MVPLDLGPTAANRVKLADDLARRLHTSLIGIAARQAAIPSYGRHTDPDLITLERERALVDLKEAERLFWRAADPDRGATWRSAVASPVGFISRQARAAGIIVVSRNGPGDGDPMMFECPAGDLLMEAGRPILVAPPNLDEVSVERMVIGWKDTREARRAVADSLPLLALATEVFIVAVGADLDVATVEDVAGYLDQNAIKASSHVIASAAGDATAALLDFVALKEAGVLVTGAYGHNRFREWVFGGVTATLLESTPVCCLMSH